MHKIINGNNGVRVGTNTNKTWTIDATSGYLKHAGTSRYLGVYTTTPDWRAYTSINANITNQTLSFWKLVSTGTACDHSYEAVVTAHTCTEGGYTTYTCSKCGESYTGDETKATGHTYVNGECTACGDKETTYAGRYYIATVRSSGNYFYMPNDLGTASTKRYTAVDTGLTTLPAEIASPEADKIFVLEKNEDGTYSIYAEGIYEFSGDGILTVN